MVESNAKENIIINWNEAPLVRWLEGAKTGTKSVYRSIFKTYSHFTGMTATQLIDEALEDAKLDIRNRKEIVYSRIVNFHRYLKEEYEVKTRGNVNGERKVLKKGVSDNLAQLNVGAIRSFYATYDIIVRMKGRRKLPRPRNTNKRMIVSSVEVKILLDNTRTPRDRAIILLAFQGGMDSSTICSLTYGNIAEGLKKDEYPLRLELTRPKTDVEFYTFIGRDGITALKSYINDAKNRGVDFSNNTPLFVTEKGKQPLEPHSAETMLKDVAMRSGLVDNKMNGGDFNPLGIHALRESFGSIMTNHSVPEPIIDFWLGHQIGEMAKVYKSLQAGAVKKYYLDNESLLNISQPQSDLKEVEKLKEEVEIQNKQFQQMYNNVVAENVKLKIEFDEMKKRVEVFEAHVQNIQKQFEKFEQEGWEQPTAEQQQKVLDQAKAEGEDFSEVGKKSGAERKERLDNLSGELYTTGEVEKRIETKKKEEQPAS